MRAAGQVKLGQLLEDPDLALGEGDLPALLVLDAADLDDLLPLRLLLRPVRLHHRRCRRPDTTQRGGSSLLLLRSRRVSVDDATR